MEKSSELNARQENETEDEMSARRDFLKKCGKYAVVVPPAMAMLLTRSAHAADGGSG